MPPGLTCYAEVCCAVVFYAVVYDAVIDYTARGVARFLLGRSESYTATVPLVW